MFSRKFYIFLAAMLLSFVVSSQKVQAATTPLLVKDATAGTGSTLLYCGYNQYCPIYNNTLKGIYSPSTNFTEIRLLQSTGSPAQTTTQVLDSAAYVLTQYKLNDTTVIVNTLPAGEAYMYQKGIVKKFDATTNQYTTLFTNGAAAGVVNGNVYVLTDNLQSGHREIHIVNGTTGVDTLLKDMGATDSNKGQSDFVALNNGTVLFEEYNYAGNATIWKTDGTTQGTVQIAAAVLTNSMDIGGTMISLGDYALFAVSPTSQTAPAEIWRTDGTEAGTYKLYDGYYYVNTWDMYGSMRPMLTVGGNTYFVVWNTNYQFSLMQTDGTVQGTSIAQTLGTSLSDFIVPVGVTNNKLYIIKYTGYTQNSTFASSSLLSFNGTTLSTVKTPFTGTNVEFIYTASPLVSDGKLYLAITEMRDLPQATASVDAKTAMKQLVQNLYHSKKQKEAYKSAVVINTYKATTYLFKVDTTSDVTETLVTRVTTSNTFDPTMIMLGMLPNDQLMLSYAESATLGKELYRVIPVPTSLQNFYYTFGRWKYNTKLTNAQLRTGDMAYLKNYNSSQLRIMQIYLYDYVKKGNQPMSWTWKSGSTAYVKTTTNLPTGRQYAFVMKMQDKATGYIVSKYFVFRL